MARILFNVGLFILLQGVIVPAGFAEQIRVAVASNFLNPMKVISKKFEAHSGNRIVISSGSSGRFYAQIKNGAPYDLFFSADQEKPLKLEKEGLTIPGFNMTYATGTLVLWSTKQGYFKTDERLKNGKFSRIAMANPKLAPYGLAAKEVLERLGLTSSVKSKQVNAENIAQTFQFVSSGNADLGFVARSQLVGVSEDQMGTQWVIPSDLHQPIKQNLVLLKRADNKKAARAFYEFMKSDSTKELIKSFGYQ